MSGVLYIVSTPIGNLEDITLRALRVLKEVDRIACEDTRHTRKLLEHFGIRKPLASYHEHNEAAAAGELIGRLAAGESIALVSDAGTPLISDPGYRIVAAARERGIQVTPIPGPSALLAALAGAGLATDAFHFAGFLPARRGERRRVLDQLGHETATVVCYEAPRRILDTLQDIEETMGPRRVVLARELTKIHEEFLSGEAGSVREALAARSGVKGEITLLIARREAAAEDDPRPLAEAVEAAMREGLSRMEAVKAVARRRGLAKREVYQAVVNDP
jgi:16S rRNA (cytidine1402-2'-O)-methyltransferase